jgi:O-acetyl-ADP-ribose deacetylase (regulator of RNase III)
MFMTTSQLRVILVDPDYRLCEAWTEAFTAHRAVTIVHGRFQDLEAFDCMVSAANSFGLMDGGVDLAIARFFGDSLVDRVQAHIVREYFGEQPVGTSFIAETDDPHHPYVAHTPTMRIPMSIKTTDYVYLAMWAMLRAVHHHNRSTRLPPIRTVACPGLGTGAGEMPAVEAARQMEIAYRWYVRPVARLDWSTAEGRQAVVGRGGDLFAR